MLRVITIVEPIASYSFINISYLVSIFVGFGLCFVISYLLLKSTSNNSNNKSHIITMMNYNVTNYNNLMTDIYNRIDDYNNLLILTRKLVNKLNSYGIYPKQIPKDLNVKFDVRCLQLVVKSNSSRNDNEETFKQLIKYNSTLIEKYDKLEQITNSNIVKLKRRERLI